MKILIETIPHSDQRYETVGDWFDNRMNIDAYSAVGKPSCYSLGPDDVLHIRVSELGDWRSEALVAVHELVEAILCKHAGVTTEAVDDFDLRFSKSRSASEWTAGGEPGDHPSAPYRDQHCFATAVERMLCAAMQVSWAEYEEAVNRLAK